MCDCDRALELLSARLDGELSDAERVELEEHLAACEECRVAADEFAAIHDSMPTLLEEVPEGFHQRLMEKIAAENVISFPVKKRHAAWKSWASMAAVFAVILVGGNALTQLGMQSAPGMPSTVAPAAAGYESAKSTGAATPGSDAPEAGAYGATPYGLEPASTEQQIQPAVADAQPTLVPAPDNGLMGHTAPRNVTGMNAGITPADAGAIAAQAEYPGAEVTNLADAGGDYSGWNAILADGSSVEVSYLGLSPNGAYFEFALADKDGGKACNRFAVKADGSAVENLNKLGQEAYHALTGAEQ